MICKSQTELTQYRSQDYRYHANQALCFTLSTVHNIANIKICIRSKTTDIFHYLMQGIFSKTQTLAGGTLHTGTKVLRTLLFFYINIVFFCQSLTFYFVFLPSLS